LQLKDLAGLYKGSMGFVIGAGPSLHFQDLSPLKDYPTITVNAGFLKFPQCDAFVSDDIGVKNWNYFIHDLKESDCMKLLYEKKLGKEAYHLNNVIFFDHKWYYSPADKALNFAGLEMTKNPWKRIIGARTACGSALHFLHIFGCDPLIILGCDCAFDRSGTRRYFWQFDGEPEAYRLTGEPVHSAANRGKHPKTGAYYDSHSANFLEYWHLLSIQTKKQGINIINASGGILESFPRLKLSEVLEKYGDRKKPKLEEHYKNDSWT